MAFKLRLSKFRHIYGSPAKKELCYESIKVTRNSHDASICGINVKFLAIVTESACGSSFIVLPIEKTGRVDINTPKVQGHSGPILDIKWNPFNDFIIATSSDDTSVKLWQIPEDGLQSNLSEWIVDLHGHQKRVSYIEWHPTTDNVLLSAGNDQKCILWNTETAEPINIIDCHNSLIQCIAWNWDGSLFATTSKDKKVRVIDPRTGNVLQDSVCHVGPKGAKVVFLGDTNRLFTTGFCKMNERQYSIWDIKNMTDPLVTSTIDSSSGMLFPFYDHDTRVMFIAGKGDGNIRYFEIVDNPPYCHYLGQYNSPNPQRCLGILPKRGVDVKRCEIMRFYKVYGTKGFCEPISMIVPRKTEAFHSDLYPPTPSATPSLTSDEWISGQNRDPILISPQDGQVSSNPCITTSKAVQRKDSTLHQAPVITTYKAVKGSRNIGQGHSISSTAPVPNSVRNIQKLSSNDNSETHMTNGPTVHECMTFTRKRREIDAWGGLNIISSLDHDFTVTKETVVETSRHVDKKTWSPTPAANEIPANMMPNTNPEQQITPRRNSSPLNAKSNKTQALSNSPTSSSKSPRSQTKSPVSPSNSPATVFNSPRFQSRSKSKSHVFPSRTPPKSPRAVLSPSKSPISPSPCMSPSTADYYTASESFSFEFLTMDIIDTTESILSHADRKRLSKKVPVEHQLVKPSSFKRGRREFRSALVPRQTMEDVSPEREGKVHIHKAWSPPKSPLEQLMSNGYPQTDPELRKAYFRQLEEIRSLKQQISMKDKRISQLEEELRCNQSNKWHRELNEGRNVEESIC